MAYYIAWKLKFVKNAVSKKIFLNFIMIKVAKMGKDISAKNAEIKKEKNFIKKIKKKKKNEV